MKRMDANMYSGNFMSPPNTVGSIGGGYPAYGYPPYIPNGYGMGQQPFSPGINVPIEATFNNGTTVTIPPQQQQAPMMGYYQPPYPQPNMGSGYNSVNSNTVNTGYIPGGATVRTGGYNPVTKTFTQPSVQQGYNPFMSSMQNPMNTNLGFEPYDPSKRTNNIYYSAQQNGLNQYNFYNYYNRIIYGQNSFNYDLQEYLYEDAINRNPADIVRMIVGDKVADNQPVGYIMGYDYYGNPIYSNPQYAYQMNQKAQEAYNKQRQDQIDIFTKLAATSAAYLGLDFDEEATRKRFDPTANIPVKKVQKNYYEMTPEEKEDYVISQHNNEAESVANYLEMMNQSFGRRQEFLGDMYKKIKDSHDRLLGVEPGTNYDLNTFLDNGYKIRIDSLAKDERAKSKTGYDKYSSNTFRTALSKETNSQIPIQSKDDEYVSIEAKLREIYEKNKAESKVLNTGGGNQFPGYTQNQHTSLSPGVYPMSPSNSEMDAHGRFMIAMQSAKDINDLKQMGKG